jgi:hypothetical protein
MTHDEIIRMAREAGFVDYLLRVWRADEGVEKLARAAYAAGVAAERKEWPNLEPVINWLENGCDPKEAAKELRTYADAIRARGQE